MKKKFVTLLTVNLTSIFGFMVAYYFEASSLYPLFTALAIVTNVSALLLLDFVDWHGLMNLEAHLKRTKDVYNRNERFIKALKNMIVEKEFPIEEIEKQAAELKSKQK
jgi:hypothetical protein